MIYKITKVGVYMLLILNIITLIFISRELSIFLQLGSSICLLVLTNINEKQQKLIDYYKNK